VRRSGSPQATPGACPPLPYPAPARRSVASPRVKRGGDREAALPELCCGVRWRPPLTNPTAAGQRANKQKPPAGRSGRQSSLSHRLCRCEAIGGHQAPG
jgi:hypothetical protein